MNFAKCTYNINTRKAEFFLSTLFLCQFFLDSLKLDLFLFNHSPFGSHLPRYGLSRYYLQQVWSLLGLPTKGLVYLGTTYNRHGLYRYYLQQVWSVQYYLQQVWYIQVQPTIGMIYLLPNCLDNFFVKAEKVYFSFLMVQL